MKSTAQIIGLFGVIQGVLIASGWLVTRSFRKIYFSINHADMGLAVHLPAASDFFASYGPFFLLIPVLWCFAMIHLAQYDTRSNPYTAKVARFSVAFTVIVFVDNAAMSFDMMKAALCPPLRLKSATVKTSA